MKWIDRKGSQDRMDRKLYRYAIAVMILSVVQYIFSLRVIGTNWRYNVAVHWGPMLVGLVLLARLRWPYLLRRVALANGVGWKALLGAGFLVQGVLFSYLSAGLIARTGMDLANWSYAKGHPVRSERFEITDAGMRGWSKGRSNYIAFKRAGSRERLVGVAYFPELDVPRDSIHYDIIVRLREGLLGTWVVSGFDLSKKE